MASAVDAEDNLLVLGSYRTQVALGGGPVPRGNPTGIYLAKYDASGAHQWSSGFLGDFSAYLYDEPTDVAIDPYGNVVVAATGSGGTDFGGGPLSGPGILLAVFDTNGEHLRSKRLPVDYGWAFLAVGADGNLTLTGAFSGALDFGGAVLETATDAQSDGFVARLTAEGTHVWSERLVGAAAADDFMTASAVRLDGRVLVAGTCNNGSRLGGVACDCSGGSALVASLDPAGQLEWSTSLGGTWGDLSIMSIAELPDGDLAIAGYYSGAPHIGADYLPNVGPDGDDGLGAFVARLDPGAVPRWSRAFFGVEPVYGDMLATDAASNLSLALPTRNAIDCGGGELAENGERDVVVAQLDGDGNHRWSRRLGDHGDQWPTSIASDTAGAVLVAGTYVSVYPWCHACSLDRLPMQFIAKLAD